MSKEELEKRLELAEYVIRVCRSTLDDVHAYESEAYDLTTYFLYGEEE